MCPTGMTSQCGSVFSITARNRFHYQCGYSTLGFFFCCLLSPPKLYIRKIPRPSPTCLVLHARTWNWNLHYTQKIALLSLSLEFRSRSSNPRGAPPSCKGAQSSSKKWQKEDSKTQRPHARTHAHTSLFSLSSVSLLCASSVTPVPHWFRTSPGWEPHLVWNFNCFGTLNWSDVVFKLE
jgi:hypothetical protein